MIPQTFHSVWVGGPMPDHLHEYLASWTAVHPRWEHRVWREPDLTGWLRNQELFDRAEEHTTNVGQFRADIARYEILHRHGGVYVDCDFEARRPIDTLIEDVRCFVAWETDGTWLNNAIIGAEPEHPFLDALIVGLSENVKRTRGKRPNVMTGPQYLTPIARSHDVVTFPAALFYPYRWDQLERGDEVFPDAYAVHHWHNARHHRRVRA